MKRFIGFEHGMGIGGWLTNYKRFNVLPMDRRLCLTVGDMEHFATYITEEDIKYISELGMDHIRLGFDQIVFEEAPYSYREEIFTHVDNFILWCKKYNLNVVLNMHKAIGNYCDIKEEVELLDDDELQNRFISLWLAFEKRYNNDNSIAFELLNEVRDVNPQKWNDLAEKTVNAIRELNKERIIIVGSTSWNSVHTLRHLKLFDDEKVIYTFHTYDPFEFTITDLLGFMLALTTIAVTVIGKEKSGKSGKTFVLPIIVAMISSGGLGIMQKVQQNSAYKSERNEFLIIAFTLAFLSSIIGFMCCKNKAKIQKRNVIFPSVAGLCFGGANLFNTILAGRIKSAAFFPLQNISVILLSTLLGIILFKEKLSLKNIAIIILGAITVIIFSI